MLPPHPWVTVQIRGEKWIFVTAFGFKGGPVMTLDSKGRLTVPAQFKDILVAAEQGQLVVCKNIERSLQLFPASVYARYEAQLRALDDSRSALKRRIIGSANDVVMDSGSRILIPPELREWAGLERNVIFMGMGNRFELWDKARLDLHEAESDEATLRAQQAGLSVD